MTLENESYQRAPGTGRTAAGYVQLWFGKNTLLQVKATSTHENYERVNYRDIMAVLMNGTASFVIWSSVLGALMLIFALIWLVNGREFGVSVVMMFVFGLLLLIHLIRGPTCECHVITAVGRYKLEAWHRTRTARRGLRKLLPLIREAQRDLV